MTEYADIIKMGNKRVWLQRGGAGPTNTLRYTGVDTQHLELTGVSRPKIGGMTPINISDPLSPERWIRGGKQKSPADAFPTATLGLYEKQDTLTFADDDVECPINLYVVTSVCKDPSNFDLGWQGKLEIFGSGVVVNVDDGDRSSLTANDPVKQTLPMIFPYAYSVGGMTFGEVGAATVVREIVDVAIAPSKVCGNCPGSNNGRSWIYALMKEDVGVAAGTVVYSTDGGTTWTSQAITGLTNTDLVKAIEVVGTNLVVLTDEGANAGYYYTAINQLTGVPVSTWTLVTTGFTVECFDLVALSPREVFFAGASGTIYMANDLGAGVTEVASAVIPGAFARIAAYGGNFIAAVGAAGDIAISRNSGLTWTRTITDAGAADLASVAWRNFGELWVVGTDGVVRYSQNYGETWATKTFPASITAGGDIAWVTEEVGWVALRTSGNVGRLFYTNNGGLTWVIHTESNNPRILSMPGDTTLIRINRLGVPRGSVETNVNHLFLAGLGAGTDGFIIAGHANVQ